MAFSPLAVLIQLAFTCGAGWLVWKAWQRLARINARAGVFIGAGLIVRAVLAQAMFWISYLHLPIARSLQDGDGFWTLAIDGRAYFGHASQMLTHGWEAVVLVDKTLPSPAFLQVLALFQLLFGGAATVGVLLNLFAYLGACAAILRLGRAADGGIATPALIAVAALSFAPAVILWSVQPLKDPLFIFAIAAFVVACTMWQEAWLARFSASHFVMPLLLMLVVMYAVVGIRWYFGLLLWAASVPYFIVSAWRSNRRLLAAVVNAAVFLGFSQVIIFAGRPYVPQQLINPFGTARGGRSSLVAVAVGSRQNFDLTRANTAIASGDFLRKLDVAPAAAEAQPRPRTRTAHARTFGEAAPEQQPQQTASLPVKPLTFAASRLTPAPSPVPVSAAVRPAEHAPASEHRRSEQRRSEQHAGQQPSTPAANQPVTTPLVGHESSRHDAERVTAAKAPRPEPGKAAVQPASTPVAKVVTQPEQPRTAVAVPMPAAPKSAAVRRQPDVLPQSVRREPDVLPQSTFARVAAGLTAVILPHFIGEHLGLIHIGGGRGLWAIVETDTLVFDGLLLLSLYYIIRTLPQGAWRNPSFWLVVLTTAGITVLLAYTISNFGTLFRHRAMIFIGLCLMLVVARETPPAPLPEPRAADS